MSSEHEVTLLSHQPQPPPGTDNTAKYRRKQRTNFVAYNMDRETLRDARSLEHWNKTVKKWDKQQAFLSKQTGIDVDKLNMLGHEAHVHHREMRTLHKEEQTQEEIDAIDFWHMQPMSKSSLHYTLTKSHKGVKSSTTFQGRPRTVQNETKAPSRIDLHAKTPLCDKKHIPQIHDLEIVGRPSLFHVDPIGSESELQTHYEDDDQDDIHSPDVLTFDNDDDTSTGEPLKERKDPLVLFHLLSSQQQQEREYHQDNFDTEVASRLKPISEEEEEEGGMPLSELQPLEPHEGCRVLFQAPPNHRCSHVVRLTNVGSTVIYYHWKECVRDNSLGRAEDSTKRFFLDIEPGSILPGASVNVQIRYLSSNSGVFYQDYELLTRPKIGTEKQLLSLCGVSEAARSYDKEKEDMQREFEVTQVEKMVRGMLWQVVDLLNTPPPQQEERKLTDAETFVALNPSLCTFNTFKEDVVAQLNTLYERLYLEELEARTTTPKVGKKQRGKSDAVQPVIPEWSMCVDDIHKMCLSLPTDDQCEEALKELYSLCDLFSPSSQDSVEKVALSRLDIGTMTFRAIANDVVTLSESVREQVGLPPRQPVDATSGRKDTKSAVRGKSGRGTSAKVGDQAEAQLDPILVEKCNSIVQAEVRKAVLRRFDQMMELVEDLPPANISLSETEG
eukprot:m.106766 g.106766  ORF g.106766 m.106766 type:complete len:671 (+) comp12681_c2_seq2:88-2100(+)